MSRDINDPRVAEILRVVSDVLAEGRRPLSIVGKPTLGNDLFDNESFFDGWDDNAALELMRAFCEHAPDDAIDELLIDARKIMVTWAECIRYNKRKAQEAQVSQ